MVVDTLSLKGFGGLPAEMLHLTLIIPRHGDSHLCKKAATIKRRLRRAASGRLIRRSSLITMSTSARIAMLRGIPQTDRLARGGCLGPSEVASPGRFTPRGAGTLQGLAVDDPLESNESPDRHRPVRP